MSPEPTVWIQIGSTIMQALSFIPKDKSRRSDHQEETLRSISRAYHDTEKYYAYLEEGNPRDSQREFDLAKAWEETSIFVKEYDENLSSRLGLKSRFWRENGTWSDDMIQDAGIQLNRVRAEGMTLFD